MNIASILRPGRPKDSVKRDEIVAAATELFMEHGFSLTSMEAVAKRANVSKLTIYSHFADKNDLFRAIIQNRCNKLGMPDNFAAEAQMQPAEAFLKIARHAVSNIFRDDSLRLMRIIMAETPRHPEIVEIYYDVGPRRIKNAFADLLRSFHAQGLLSIADPVRASEQFVSLLKGERLQRTLMFMQQPPTPEDLEEHVKATVAFFLAAYRPQEPK